MLVLGAQMELGAHIWTRYQYILLFDNFEKIGDLRPPTTPRPSLRWGGGRAKNQNQNPENSKFGIVFFRPVVKVPAFLSLTSRVGSITGI